MKNSKIRLVQANHELQLVHTCASHDGSDDHVFDISLLGPKFTCRIRTDGSHVFIGAFLSQLELVDSSLQGDAFLVLHGPPGFQFSIALDKKGGLRKKFRLSDHEPGYSFEMEFGGDQTDLRALILTTRALVKEVYDPTFRYAAEDFDVPAG